ncbi:MAG: hypothetical protein IK128_06430 [Clostridiales bacterium]|nr:hypothetical protein [Clostridiales bacterium]
MTISKHMTLSVYHYSRLVLRIITFLVLFNHFYLSNLTGFPDILGTDEIWNAATIILFVVFIIEMAFRFFPNPLECRGVQKQFKRNYAGTGSAAVIDVGNKGAMLAAMLFFGGNAVFGLLHMLGIFDDRVMILLASIYSICDIVCILFFCPFQSWFLHNKCCTTCRIYNWDFAMLFTPMFFVDNWYGRILLGMAAVLMLRWELAFFLHPEYFSESTNEYLKCANCDEKLCAHKNRLRKTQR